MRSEWVEPDALELLLTAMTPRTRLAMRMALCSGLRIGDIVQLRTEDIHQRMTVKEAKTGKSRGRLASSVACAREASEQIDGL